MVTLPIRTWVRNAAAVFSGRHGAVTDQAREASCSRETVYEHALKVEQRLATAAEDTRQAADLEAENGKLRRQLDEAREAHRHDLSGDPIRQRRFATTAFAMGVSLRQIEDLLELVLPPGEAPDHSTLGRWVGEQAERAGPILAVLDTACAPRVQTLCLDEIFFGGDRPWSGSSRPA
jgi:hypothetical protein